MPAEQLAIGDRGAVLSDDGVYRYRLWRCWGPGPRVLFVMLNPSTADAEADDPTIRRCMGFARRWGFDGIEVVNLYAYRATDPKDLERAAKRHSYGFEGAPPVIGEYDGTRSLNDEAIGDSAYTAARIIVAWGGWPGPLAARAVNVARRLRAAGTVEALRVTKTGQPCHPVRLPYELEPVIYRGAA